MAVVDVVVVAVVVVAVVVVVDVVLPVIRSTLFQLHVRC